MQFAPLLLILSAATLSANGQDLRLYYPINGDFKNNDGIWTVFRGETSTLELIGTGLDTPASITLTESETSCATRFAELDIDNRAADGSQASVSVTTSESVRRAYFCLDDLHQGTDNAVVLALEDPPDSGELLPTWITVIFLCVLLVMSGLFSGLNLGLMALDPKELEIVATSGEEKERGYAKTILPLRKRGNLLLCTVLLGNVLVNSTLTILMDSITGGVGAVLGSTAGIVVFGEIMPQSICSRHGLAVGAKTIWLTKFFMVLTFPVAYPISLMLDYILGDEVGAVYQRKQLLELLKMQDPYNDLEMDEVKIMTGALTFRDKTAESVMTKLGDVFMVELSAVLDFKTVTRIMDSGHSRIPVYVKSKDNIVGLLYVKDLAFIDPDDKTPLESVIKYYNHQLVEVFSHDKLDKLLELFKQGRSHMVLVIEIDYDVEDRDPVREVVGIATLEDVIEEIIQDEIIDETDRVVDNVTKTLVPRDRKPSMPELPNAFASRKQDESKMSEQMALAAYTYLSTVTEPFSSTHLLSSVLRKLISQPSCLREYSKEDAEMQEEGDNGDGVVYVYRRGQRTGVFTLVLEGRIQVTVGKDNFVFDAGPFNTIALGCLTNKDWVCDFDAVLKSDKALLLQIPRTLYTEAVSTSRRIVNQGFGGSSPMLGTARAVPLGNLGQSGGSNRSEGQSVAVDMNGGGQEQHDEDDDDGTVTNETRFDNGDNGDGDDGPGGAVAHMSNPSFSRENSQEPAAAHSDTLVVDHTSVV
eukprot:TRINITY_DN10384_c0_g1_i1.p1 TRINITY_DN10384_c0_g1~~TRINITY_DN10384_c0_g1_i1.p1  ORF type:complete len:756 (+),score=232.22 TRINITY_DN10384_c0_g1_i1:111-2378(+)